MKLFEIDEQIRKLIDGMVDLETGELPEEIVEQIDHLEIERDRKVLELAAYIKELESEGEAVKAESLRLAKRAATCMNRADRLRRYIVENLPVGQKLKDPRVSLFWSKSTATVVNPEAPPVETWPIRFLRITTEPNLTALKEALEAKEDDPTYDDFDRETASVLAHRSEKRPLVIR